MRRAIESPFVDAESFAYGHAARSERALPELRAPTLLPDGESGQFGDLLESATSAAAAEAGDPILYSAEDERGAAFEQEASTSCSDSGYGIIGADDRRKVAHTLDVPFRWICQVWARRRDSNGKVTETGATGVLISPRHVLTVAHLVRSSEKNNRGHWITSDATQIRVSPGRDGNDRPLGTHDVTLPAKVAPRWDPIRKPAGYDYALLTLEKPIGDEAFSRLGGRKLCYWGSRACGQRTAMRRLPPDPLNGRTANTAGYPNDKGKTSLYATQGIVTGANFRSRIMSISADACQGQSGSPVWVTTAGEHCLIGMMVSVHARTNVALRVTDEMCAQLRTWLQGASDVCAPRAAAAAPRPQPELEHHPAPCRCSRERAADAGGNISEPAMFTDGTPLLELDDESAAGELIDGVEHSEYDAREARAWEGGDPELELDDDEIFEIGELDPKLSDLAERTMAREHPFVEHDVTPAWTRCFPAAAVNKVKKAYEDNTAAAGGDPNDRCSCIVMLNVALGQLLPLTLTSNRARGTSTRQVQMAALTTKTIEDAMQQLRRKGFATSPTVMDFVDRRNRRAGTLTPERLAASVQDKVLALSTPGGCWYAYGLSIMDGYHSVLLLVDRTGAAARIYWLDQFSATLDDDVTATLDERITTKTQNWWQTVMDTKKKGYDTTIRIWPLRRRK